MTLPYIATAIIAPCKIPPIFTSGIAEGVARPTAADCARFLSYAISSAFEVESHLILAETLSLNLVGIEDALDETRQVRRMTHGLRKYYVEKVKREKKKGRDS